MKDQIYSTLFSFCCVLFLASACAQGAYVSGRVTPTPAIPTYASPTSASATGRVYTDAKLGFQLTLLSTWQAHPESGTQSSSGTTAVQFTIGKQASDALILVGVFQGHRMPSAFAARGTPTTHIGAYPAFVADRTLGEGRAPCLVRIFLAGDDYVLADWCAPDAFAHRLEFEQFLATYQPAAATFVPHTITIPQPQTCADMQHMLGYTRTAWGIQLATPLSVGWRQTGSGAFVCSNDNSPDWYLFQCTELANRFLLERWGLPHLPGNAARYYDYYQDGVLHPGTIREFPAGSYQLSDDASQGTSAFPPEAGDLLVFQDVNNPAVGWTSGLTSSPGHVAVIVGVDATHVYIAQENYNDTQFFLALPFQHVLNGYKITDLSGWSQRIVRGWIHFTVDGGPQTTT